MMTNQGDLVNRIMRAGNRHEKESLVKTDQPVTETFIESMSAGVYLKELDVTTRPCRAEKTGVREFRIVLTQGLNRQIRRMCEAHGFKVERLKRVRIMNIRLGGLKTGEYREVSGREYGDCLLYTSYSLTSYTIEERVTRKCIEENEVDVLINVVDASSLERNLYLTLQLLELKKPVIVALNMMDIVEERGMEIDLHRLPEMLGHVPVVPVSARKRTGPVSYTHLDVYKRQLRI